MPSTPTKNLGEKKKNYNFMKKRRKLFEIKKYTKISGKSTTYP